MEPKEELRQGAENYFSVLEEYSVGPQIEGIAPEAYQEVINDPSTITISIDGTTLPLLGKLKYAEWINGEFFEDKGYDTSELYFCLLPQEFVHENQEEASRVINEQVEEKGDILAVIDYPDLPEVTPMSDFYEGVSTDRLITSVETPAATYHYRAKFTPIPEKVEEFETDEHVKVINDPEEIEEHFERIWDIYQRQFKDLVDDHPINGAIPKDVLKQTIMSEGSDLYAYLDDDNVVQSFGYIVRDFELCPWLNKDYFDAESDGRQVMYMPGIATAPESGLSVSTKIMESLLYHNIEEFGEWVVTFECSNISSQYIPMLVERATESAGIARFSGLKETKHMYEVVSFGDSE